jgi:hypothetical protein
MEKRAESIKSATASLSWLESTRGQSDKKGRGNELGVRHKGGEKKKMGKYMSLKRRNVCMVQIHGEAMEKKRKKVLLV